MTPRTSQYNVFWPLLSNSKHLGVPEDSKSPTLEVLGFTRTLGQSGVATILIKPGIRIELASDMPIFCHPYRYSDMERDLIRSQMLDLLEARLMELSHGEYALAIVMPTKKDVHGNYTDRRMFGNYRPINR